MNIVKFKDVILNEETAPSMTQEMRDLFNTKFRDKYVYALNWNYLIPLEEIDEGPFAILSKAFCKNIEDVAPEQIPVGMTIVDWAAFREYADFTATEKTNKTAALKEANRFSSDSEITLDELKKFRTWLAETLYNVLVGIEEYDTVEMLNYYKLEMNDDTIKHLTHFAPSTTVDILNTTVKSTCGCQGATGVNLLGSVTTCDPIYQYRKAVYEKMVSVFSEIAFWTEREEDLLIEIKKYIDGIIAHNLPLTSSQYTPDLYDCGCLSDADASQERLMNILKKLSKAFGFMIEGQVTGNRNFIGDTLNQWAAYLYERMRWY